MEGAPRKGEREILEEVEAKSDAEDGGREIEIAWQYRSVRSVGPENPQERDPSEGKGACGVTRFPGVCVVCTTAVRQAHAVSQRRRRRGPVLLVPLLFLRAGSFFAVVRFAAFLPRPRRDVFIPPPRIVLLTDRVV